MSKNQFLNYMPYLSYYQSSLRNIVIFTTLSMTFLSQAGVYKSKNTLYNGINLLFSLVFLLVGVILNWLLISTTKSFNKTHADSSEYENYLYILYSIFGLMIIYLLFILFRIYRNFLI